MPAKQTAPMPERAQPSPAPVRSSTGERDENYALISVLYHALQGADTIDRYILDAREAEDEALVEFFEESKQDYVDRATEAKALLAARIDFGEEGEEEEEEEEEEEGE